MSEKGGNIDFAPNSYSVALIYPETTLAHPSQGSVTLLALPLLLGLALLEYPSRGAAMLLRLASHF